MCVQKFIKNISDYIQKRKYRRQANELAAIRKESKRVIQIREFHSQLYFSYNDIPLIDVRCVEDAQAVLADARKTREDYFYDDIIK